MVFNWEFVKQQGLTLTPLKDANTFQLLKQGLSNVLLAPKKSCFALFLASVLERFLFFRIVLEQGREKKR